MRTRLPRALALLLLAPAGVAQVAAPAAPKQAATKPELTGRLEKLGETQVLYLWGNNEQRGFTEGYLRGKELQSTFRGWVLKLVPGMLWSSVIVPQAKKSFAVTDRQRARAAAMLRGMRARDPKLAYIPEIKRELRVSDLLTIPAMIDSAGLMCSSVAAWGDDVAGKGPIVGRNLDYPGTKVMLDNTLLIVQAPEGERRGIVAVGWSAAWLTTGVNDAGVFVAIHDVRARKHKGAKCTPRVIALQELLERVTPSADTAGDAAAVLREHAFAYGCNGMFAWRKGDNRGGAVLEFGPAAEKKDRVAVRKNDARSWIVCTNHWRSRRDPTGCRRYARIARATRGHGEPAVDGDVVWKFAAEGRVGSTLHTVLADLGAGTLRAELRRAPNQDKWRRFGPVSVAKLLAGARPRAKVEPASNGRR